MIKTNQVIRVGIADLNIAKKDQYIRTSGLGSCVGVVVYDSSSEIAGLAHIMLPDSSLAKEDNRNDYKYADTAIKILVDKLVVSGARRYRLKAKLAGGAQMFQFASKSDTMRIGHRNAEAVKEILSKYNIPIIASDLGGNNGRTIEFDTTTGDLHIRTVYKDETII